ncbi:hypothetical protein BZG36_04938, partial [Bifiguratus adelaidae]
MSFSAFVLEYLFPGSALTNSLLATAYISLFPNLLLYFVPPDIDTASLNTLVAFAVGGLLGDVFLHLLPHAFLGEHFEADAVVAVDERKNVLVGLGIFVGLAFFYVMDKGMRVLNGGDGQHAHGHTHAVESSGHSTGVQEHTTEAKKRGKKAKKGEEEDDKDNAVDHKPTSSIKLSAYLNLFADATHNFTDGLALSASFYASPAVGATTAVAVFFHEIPHEVGDYAILIQSGFSKQRAMMAQFTTAVGAFLGTLAGIAIEETQQDFSVVKGAGIAGTDLRWGDLVIPFTAGGFLYIATVGVIPELLQVSGHFRKDARQMMYEIVALSLFSSPTCSLCATAKQSIERVQQRVAVPTTLKVIHINTQECPPDLSQKYMFDIPVVHLNDEFLCMHRVDEAWLEQKLKEAAQYHACGNIRVDNHDGIPSEVGSHEDRTHNREDDDDGGNDS